MCRPIAITALSLLACCISALAAESDVEGMWVTGDGDSIVEITRIAGGLSGRVAGSLTHDPGKSTPDRNNPDPALRDRELLGLELFAGFEFDGDDRWVSGKIYDPNDGNTYSCHITIVDRNTLKVRGYIGFSLFGRTEMWIRTPDPD